MKKNLFTCFLALLCLYGSTGTAQVADSPSPGADFLHRSGPHRGGETRSDVFPRNTPHEIDGAPWSVSLRSLGSCSEVTEPVEVPNPWIAVCDPETANCKLGPANWKMGFSLVDDSIPQGQQGEISSAQVGDGMLYIEIASPNPPDTLWVTYWEHLLEDSKAVTSGIAVPLIGEKGTYFEGSSGTVEFVWRVPADLTSGYFSLSLDKAVLARQWSLSSSHRARVRFDLISGITLFGGPKADFFRTQYLLDQLFREANFNSDPILIARSSEGLFADAPSAAAYRKAHSQPRDLQMRMKVLVPDDNGWDHLLEYLAKPVALHPAWRVLESARPLLTDGEYVTLEARVKGEILMGATKRAEIIAGQLIADKEKATLFLRWASEIHAEQAGYPHTLLIRGLTRLEILESKIRGEEPLDNLAEYPAVLRDELIGYFLLSNYNRLKGNLDSYLQIGIGRVQTPWISEKLIGLREVQLGLFVSEGLSDEAGKPVNLERYSGKTLLIHFWISGCKFCVDDYRQLLTPLGGMVDSDPSILIVTVNGDGSEESWKASLASGNYTSETWLNLRADRHSGVLDRYSIHSFPQKMVIGPDSSVRLQTLDKIPADRMLALLQQIQAASDTSFSSTQTYKP